MNEPILNRVSKSSLETIDLETYRLKGNRYFFDIKNVLENGLVLRENIFREYVKMHDWSKYSQLSLISVFWHNHKRSMV